MSGNLETSALSKMVGGIQEGTGTLSNLPIPQLRLALLGYNLIRGFADDGIEGAGKSIISPIVPVIKMFGGFSTSRGLRTPEIKLPSNLSGLGIISQAMTASSYRKMGERSRLAAKSIKTAVNPFLKRAEFLGLGDLPSIQRLQKATRRLKGSASFDRRQAAITAFGFAKAQVTAAMDAFGKDTDYTGAFETETGISYDVFRQEYTRQSKLRMAKVKLKAATKKASNLAIPAIRSAGRGAARKKRIKANRADWSYEDAVGSEARMKKAISKASDVRKSGRGRTQLSGGNTPKQRLKIEYKRLKSGGYYKTLNRIGSLQEQISTTPLADIGQFSGVFADILKMNYVPEPLPTENILPIPEPIGIKSVPGTYEELVESQIPELVDSEPLVSPPVADMSISLPEHTQYDSLAQADPAQSSTWLQQQLQPSPLSAFKTYAVQTKQQLSNAYDWFKYPLLFSSLLMGGGGQDQTNMEGSVYDWSWLLGDTYSNLPDSGSITPDNSLGGTDGYSRVSPWMQMLTDKKIMFPLLLGLLVAYAVTRKGRK